MRSDIDIIYLDDSWVNDISTDVQTIESLSELGIPIISLDGADSFIDTEGFGSVAYSEQSSVCGYYRNPTNGATYCYSIECDDYDESLKKAQSWASDVGTRSSIIPGDKDVVYEKEMQCGTRGWFYIEAWYSYKGTLNGYDYWTVRYYMETTPSSGSCATLIKVYDDFGSQPLDGQLLEHAPGTTEGSTTNTVEASISTTDLGISISTSYSINDVTITNNSSRISDVYLIEHHLVRNSLVSTNTYYCKPIAIFKCDSGDSDHAFCPLDQYTVKYDYQIGNSWYSETFNTNVQAILYPDR